MSPRDREPQLILNEAQLECLKSPLRSEILSLLMAEGPMSVADLGRSTGYPQKSLYYPLRKLVACGLARPTAVSEEGRRPEQLFDSVAEALQLPEAAPETTALSNKALIGVMSVALREVVRATDSPNTPDIACHRLVARLTDSDRDELLLLLEQVSVFIRERTNYEAPAYSLTMALVPRISSTRRLSDDST